MVVMLGEIALGGGDLMVVVESDFVVELLVDSVTIGSAKAKFDNKVITKIAKTIFLDILVCFLIDSIAGNHLQCCMLMYIFNYKKGLTPWVILFIIEEMP